MKTIDIKIYNLKDNAPKVPTYDRIEEGEIVRILTNGKDPMIAILKENMQTIGCSGCCIYSRCREGYATRCGCGPNGDLICEAAGVFAAFVLVENIMEDI